MPCPVGAPPPRILTLLHLTLSHSTLLRPTCIHTRRSVGAMPGVGGTAASFRAARCSRSLLSCPHTRTHPTLSHPTLLHPTLLSTPAGPWRPCQGSGALLPPEQQQQQGRQQVQDSAPMTSTHLPPERLLWRRLGRGRRRGQARGRFCWVGRHLRRHLARLLHRRSQHCSKVRGHHLEFDQHISRPSTSTCRPGAVTHVPLPHPVSQQAPCQI